MTSDITPKIAHTAQIVVTAAICVADPSGLTMAATVTTGALSLPEVFKRNPDATRKLTKTVSKKLTASLKKPTFHMPAKGPVLLPQMLDQAMLTPNDLVDCGLNPDLILGRLLDRHVDSEHRTGEMAEAFCNWLRPPLTDLLNDPEFVENMAPAIWASVLTYLNLIVVNTDILAAQFRDTAIELGATQERVMALARRVATDVPDIDAAHRELENHFDRLTERKERLSQGSNIDDWVDVLLQEMDALAQNSGIEMAVQRGRDAKAAMQDELERQKAGYLRIIDETLSYEIESRDVGAIANSLIEKLQIEMPDSSQQFEALRVVQDQWYEKGREMGLALELEVAIELAQRCFDWAIDGDQRGSALIDLGNALSTLGERESGTARLVQAVQAYENALQEYTQARVPLQWAMTQNNLGNALSTLGERESGTARLEQAVLAYENALQERTQTRVPLDWAMTQNNLGAALQTLGQRESGTARLEQAVLAYENALQERTRTRVPLQWAMTQNNLGNALSTLGERESGTARLEQAVLAYENALQERTQTRVPLDWAGTQFNLGGVHLAYFDKTQDAGRLDLAEAHVRAALELFEQAAPHYAAMAQQLLAQIAAQRN